MNGFAAYLVAGGPANESPGAFSDAAEAHLTTVPTGIGNCLTRGQLPNANLFGWDRLSRSFSPVRVSCGVLA